MEIPLAAPLLVTNVRNQSAISNCTLVHSAGKVLSSNERLDYLCHTLLLMDIDQRLQSREYIDVQEDRRWL